MGGGIDGVKKGAMRGGVVLMMMMMTRTRTRGFEKMVTRVQGHLINMKKDRF